MNHGGAGRNGTIARSSLFAGATTVKTAPALLSTIDRADLGISASPSENELKCRHGAPRATQDVCVRHVGCVLAEVGEP